ncbi:MAG: hypothetical protein EXR36_09460 [Betaproteobacteria bacterium]|nr:hypothetical protein [Betaproteobacteria bacterium]
MASSEKVSVRDGAQCMAQETQAQPAAGLGQTRCAAAAATAWRIARSSETSGTAQARQPALFAQASLMGLLKVACQELPMMRR